METKWAALAAIAFFLVMGVGMGIDAYQSKTKNELKACSQECLLSKKQFKRYDAINQVCECDLPTSGNGP